MSDFSHYWRCSRTLYLCHKIERLRLIRWLDAQRYILRSLSLHHFPKLWPQTWAILVFYDRYVACKCIFAFVSITYRSLCHRWRFGQLITEQYWLQVAHCFSISFPVSQGSKAHCSGQVTFAFESMPVGSYASWDFRLFSCSSTALTSTSMLGYRGWLAYFHPRLTASHRDSCGSWV